MFLFKLLFKLIMLPFTIIGFVLILPLIVFALPFMLFGYVLKLFFGITLGFLGIGLIAIMFSFVVRGFRRVVAW